MICASAQETARVTTGRKGVAGLPPIVLATYNVHGAIGRDGVFSPERVAAVLAEIGAGVVALQEVQTGRTGRHLLHHVSELLDAQAITGMTLTRKDAEFGNAILTRYPVLAVERMDLSVPPHEPRGALDVVVDCGAWQLRVLATHLGLWPYERRRQVSRLLGALDARADGRLEVHRELRLVGVGEELGADRALEQE